MGARFPPGEMRRTIFDWRRGSVGPPCPDPPASMTSPAPATRPSPPPLPGRNRHRHVKTWAKSLVALAKAYRGVVVDDHALRRVARCPYREALTYRHKRAGCPLEAAFRFSPGLVLAMLDAGAEPDAAWRRVLLSALVYRTRLPGDVELFEGLLARGWSTEREVLPGGLWQPSDLTGRLIRSGPKAHPFVLALLRFPGFSRKVWVEGLSGRIEVLDCIDFAGRTIFDLTTANLMIDACRWSPLRSAWVAAVLRAPPS